MRLTFLLFLVFAFQAFNLNAQTIVTGHITENTVWTEANSPFLVIDELYVDNNVILTIQSGVVIKFQYNTNTALKGCLNVFGLIDLQGTAANPIVFTSERDDTYGGDTNGDGNTTSAVKGDWGFLKIDCKQTDTKNISNCIFRYGGYGYDNRHGTKKYMLWLNSENSLYGNINVNNCIFEESYETGIFCSGFFQNCKIQNCKLSNIDGFGINNSTSNIINCANNYWGHSSGPFHPVKNSDGQGVQVSNNVDFEPFLSEEPDFQLIPADFNKDYNVNGFDLAQLAVAFGSTSENNTWNELCDLDFSGLIDGYDLAIFASYFGQTSLKSGKASLFYNSSKLKLDNNAKLYMETNFGHIKSNSEISVFIKAKDFAEAIGLAVRVNYDNEIFELIEIKKYDDLDNMGEIVFMSKIFKDNGSALVGLASLDNTVNGINGSGIVCELIFKSKEIKFPFAFKFSNSGLLAMDGTTKLSLKTNDLNINLTSNIDYGIEPGILSLFQNYPNPFSTNTKINFQIPTGNKEKVKLAIYNLLGQEVNVLIDKILDSGEYSYEFKRFDNKGTRLPAGIYYYKIFNGDATISRKMMILE